MKPIFNSLGSQYSLGFCWYVLKGLWVKDTRIQTQFHLQLNNIFGGKVGWAYKGRDAITLALRDLKISAGDAVITQAFSCIVVEEAIKKSGAIVEFADIKKGKVGPGLSEIKKVYSRSRGKVKAVLLQHLFGYPPKDYREIVEWCGDHKIHLIDDLAQSWGACDDERKIIGTRSQAVVWSFGRDKVVDAVAGGAWRVKNITTPLPSLKPIPRFVVVDDFMYPILTWIIRTLYPIKIGKLLHFLLKKIGHLRSPVVVLVEGERALPEEYFPLIWRQWQSLKQVEVHRRAIARYYLSALPSPTQLVDNDDVDRGANVRFPLWVNNPEIIINKLDQKGIYVSDRWYRAAVDKSSLSLSSSYQPGLCPQAEKLAKHILNLPTHRGISLGDAHHIVQEVVTCLNSQ